MDYRIEHDTLGEVRVPRDCYYGAQTQRAVENFPISGLRLQPAFVRAQAIIKHAAAKANMASGRLEQRIGEALVRAAAEIIEGRFADQFVVDVFQAGAGTSQNMNINEVLANRAIETLGGRLGDYSLVHPNDHANMSQSTNDTIHAAIYIAAFCEIHERLLPSLRRLEDALRKKANEFDSIVKSGRTHLQDAVPIRLGQEFGAYATMIHLGQQRVQRAADALRELCLGGTAVGTELNTDPLYKNRAIAHINESTGYEFKSAANLFEAMQSMDAVVEVSGALRVLVTSLRRIADDLRLLSSGPRTGLGEIRLPAVQPGSSIMPGKVNPVMAEMLNMVCFHAMGCDMAILHAAQAGQLELNVMMPVIAYNLLQEIDILAGATDAFTTRCVVGIEANEDICRKYAERSSALATALSPYIGYHKAAELAKEALDRNIHIRDLVLEKKLLDEKTADEVLDTRRMTDPPESKGK
ncbi:aspartate ammonia-lyase [candidate division BRC1 bacterium SM23_51]|nr:MAG: aspartate ammonia-lyase [candidate division BRC1 bacterium SM23_51]